MRLPIVLFLIVLAVFILTDIYIYAAIRERCKHHCKWWLKIELWTAVVLLGSPLVLMTIVGVASDNGIMNAMMWSLFTLFSVYVPKVIWVVFDLLSKIPTLWKRKPLKWVCCLGWIGAVLIFALMWWGALFERYQIKVNEVEIARADVPEAFDGFRIAQISDLHLGTYGSDTTYIAKVVERVNSMQPDMIVFTGDAVNRRSDEMEPFVNTLARLDAPGGVFSVMGNHDFGKYYKWESQSAQIENLADMYHLQSMAGWRLLNNATDFIEAGNDSIAIIGVENIGDPMMGTYGDLEVAYPGNLGDGTFKILLSHNPYHWLHDIKDHADKNIALTLSGHTHAMQMILLGWSPAKYKYEAWGGLYGDSEDRQQLYVNIGIGEIGAPMRMGSATPEITLLTLKKK